MNDWQDIAVICLVIGAILYVVRVTWRRLRGTSAGCETCSGCASEAGAQEERSETIELEVNPSARSVRR